MTLDELTTLLGKATPELVLPNGFTKPHSYRGYYDELAFEPAENVTVSSVLAAAWSADGETYTGYKGGEYTMTGDTTCWIAHEGSAGGEEITPELLAGLLAAGSKSAPAKEASTEPLTPEREQEIRKRRTHCEATRWETEGDRPVHAWGPSDYPTRDMCQRCTTMRTWAEETNTDEAVLLAEVDRLRARVTELEAAAGTARAMHRKHTDSEHCQYDDMTWPCPTVTALGDQVPHVARLTGFPMLSGRARHDARVAAELEATQWKRLGIDPSEGSELAEGAADLDAMRAQHPAP